MAHRHPRNEAEMTGGAVVLVGTWDTKGDDYEFLREEIGRRGVATLTVDVGIRGETPSPADFTPEQVAREGGGLLHELVRAGDRSDALSCMARGAAAICRDLHKEGRVAGLIAMGGGGGTMVGTTAMRALPLGVPKLMVSTLASGDTARYIDISDIVMMPAVVDISGLNTISRGVYRRAAATICGMVDRAGPEQGSGDESSEKPAVAVSMFGNTMRAVGHARARLEAAGFEVVTFHATGTGGRTMEALISNGHFAGVLDLTTTEIADELLGGILSAGPERLAAASAMGIPQIVAPGCIDMCNFGRVDTLPDEYHSRLWYQWDPNVTLVRTNPEENRAMAGFMAEHLNTGTGPVEVHIPLGGFSELDVEGGPFWLPDADQAFARAMAENVRPGIPVRTAPWAVNDEDFAVRLADALIKLISSA